MDISPSFIYSLVDEYLCCFYIFALKSAAMNISVHLWVPICFISLGHIPRSGTAISYDNSVNL